jgi:protein-tyrosine phosphatase
MNEFILNHYNYITDCVAIGDKSSSYDDFNVIINAAYINKDINNLEWHEIKKEIRNQKYIISIGIYDKASEKDFLLETFEKIMPFLLHLPDHTKILFHCQAGKSRSVSMALLYLTIKLNMTILDTYILIKSKRPEATINYEFLSTIQKYIKNLNL